MNTLQHGNPAARVMVMVQDWIHYDPETGLFTWLRSPNRRIKVGDVAGTSSHGYVKIKIQGKAHFAHLLAWYMMTGTYPEQIDHENGDRSDNRFLNLRVATSAQNRQNVFVPQRNNRSGFRGVFKGRRGWQAHITVDQKTRHLGVFESPEEAHQAYLMAKQTHHPFARR